MDFSHQGDQHLETAALAKSSYINGQQQYHHHLYRK